MKTIFKWIFHHLSDHLRCPWPHATLLIFLAFSLSGCETYEKPLATFSLNDSTYIAAVNSSQIFLGTLENGAWAYLSERSLERLEAPNFVWQMANDASPPIDAVASAPEAQLAITASGSNLAIWNTQSGKSKHFLSAPAAIKAVAINSKGTLAVLGLVNHTATVIDLMAGGVKQTLVHRSPVISVAIDDQGKILVGEEANFATLWQMGREKPLLELEHNDAVTHVGLSPDGQIAISASRYDQARFWRAAPSHSEIARVDTKAMALKAGKRVMGHVFRGNNQVTLAFSDRTVQQFELPDSDYSNTEIIQNGTTQGALDSTRQWSLAKRTVFTKDSATIVGFGDYQNQIIAIMSSGQVHVIDQQFPANAKR